MQAPRLNASLAMLARLRHSGWVFPAACVVAAALVVISEAAYFRSSQSMDRLGRMADARADVHLLLQRMVDAETGQRGYLLSGRREYLAPYEEAARDVDAAMQRLREYYHQKHDGAGEAGSPPRSEPLKALDELIHRRMSELNATMALYERGRREAWQSILLTDIGRQQMEGIRALATQLLAEEARRAADGREEVADTLRLNRVGVTTLCLLSLLALGLYLRQTRSLDEQQALQQLAIEAERDRLEEEVERRTAQLTELAHHLQTAREDERSRLARELHDELGALLTAAKLDAARIKAKVNSLPPDLTSDVGLRLTHLNDALNQGIALKRRIIEDLRPSSLDNLGLAASLEIQAREFAERSGLEVHCSVEPLALAPDVQLTVYRFVQEAFTNIAKHAKARQVQVTLKLEAGEARVSVSDDGVGFDTAAPRLSAHGLLGMRYRVEADGGRFQLVSSPRRGTELSASLPVRDQAELLQLPRSAVGERGER